jgi:hypothetical protein
MKNLLLTAVALSLAAGPALAAGGTSASVSSSGSEAVAIVQQAPSDPPASDPSDPSDPSGTTRLNETLHNTPDIAISSYAGGTNPCGIGGQLGVAVAGFGIGGGIATVSKECTMRSWYVLLAATAGHTHNPVYMQWATGVACANPDLRQVAPPGVCAPVVKVAAANPPPAARPVAYAQPRVVQVAPTRVAVAQPQRRPDWCDTVTGPAERAYYGRICGFVR